MDWVCSGRGGGPLPPGPPPPRSSKSLGPSPWTPLPFETKVTTVRKNKIHNWENLVGPFLVHKLLGPRLPLPPPPPVKHSPGARFSACIFIHSERRTCAAMQVTQSHHNCSHCAPSPDCAWPSSWAGLGHTLTVSPSTAAFGCICH